MELQEGIRNSAFQDDEDSRSSVNSRRSSVNSRRSSVNSRSSDHAQQPAEKGDSTSVKLDRDSPDEYKQIKPYAGMPKEVLLRYSTQARYRVPREILFWLTVACTLALVALTIAVIAISPPCLSWWQTTPVYQVYPRSFKDSNGDGIGDLKGIRENLDHFEYLNIKAIWISPFYLSPMKDFGYDVQDFRVVDPIFGTMEDFDELLAEMHSRGLKLIMDLIPNHTSDKHRWFNLSQARDPHYDSYYIWVDCNATGPKPNNWVGVFGNSTWEYDPVRGQCYMHQFLKEQPDLNYRNKNVVQELHDIIHFWLEKGVDGFRMDAVKHILEAEHLRNEPQVDPNKPPEQVVTEWDLHHDYTYNQVGLHDLMRGFRAEMDLYSREPGKYRFMVSEAYDYYEIEKTMMYYSTPLVKESDFPFNFYLVYLPQNTSGWWASQLVELWMSRMPTGKWPNWVVGNHDRHRIGSSVGEAYIGAINMMLLTLPGTPTTYYGEEIGMLNINITQDQVQDPFGKTNFSATRDPERSPMQWNSGLNAGFNELSNLTWLPVHPNYETVNVEIQKTDEGSTLAQYRYLNDLRQSDYVFTRGWMCFLYSDENIFAFLREMDGMGRAYLVVLNFGKVAATIDFSYVEELPDQLTVLRSTIHTNSDKQIQKSSIHTEVGEGLLIRYSTHTRYHPNHSAQCYVSEKACYMSALDILYKC
ncbi:uncharacterized protein V6R79_021506 [Siganus canaliculatus]